MSDFRVGVMYYHRSNHRQIGQRNVAVHERRISEHTARCPQATHRPGERVSFYNLIPAFTGRQDNVFDSEPLLDDVERRGDFRGPFSQRWQLVAGLTLGKNFGGVVGTATTADLNDPNNEQISRKGSKVGLGVPAVGIIMAPFEINLSGSYIERRLSVLVADQCDAYDLRH